MNRKSSPVKISAEGIAGSGRTIILTVIQKALIDAGFTSVIYENPEMTTEDRFRCTNEVVEQGDPEFFCKAISLVEVQTPRSEQ